MSFVFFNEIIPFLRLIQDLKNGRFEEMGRQRETHLGGGGHAPPGNFEIQVLGNAISSVLRDDSGRFNTLTKHLFLKLIC